MTRPAQRDLFAPAKEPPPEPFEFTGEGCEPDPTWTPPDHLKLPSDEPDWTPKGRFG